MVDKVARKAAEREAAIAEAEIARIDEHCAGYARRRAEQVRIRDKAKLTAQGIDPCQACDRLVASPCHDRDGYHEGGPWDRFCTSVFYPAR